MRRESKRILRAQKKRAGKRKKGSSGPRIAMYLPVLPGLLYTWGMAFWAAIKADQAHFGTPYPPANVVDMALANLHQANQDAESGDPASLVAQELAADKCRSVLRQLGLYAEDQIRSGPAEEAPQLMANLMLGQSKVGQRKPRPEIGVKEAGTTGNVLLAALPVLGAVAFFWEYSLDQVTWLNGPHVPQTKATLNGLTSGKVYYFRFRVLKRDGTYADYSNVVSFLVK